ncbi:EamA family transporter [Nigerium massiliense]|uniref:EamA family transporter n=1 Tax=Nigerium massiliense TaxID=1522317 RepID=UPI00058EFFAD|nr:EamA family transporter [Nigerium massiliense]
MPRRDVGLALLVVVTWGVNFVAAKIAMESLPPLLMTVLRFVMVAFPAVLLVKPPGNGWKTVVGVGLTMSALQFGLLYTGMMLGLPAGLASLVLQVQSIFTVVIAVIALGERPTAIQVTGIVVGLAGMAVVGWQYIASAPALPFLLAVGAALCWATGNVLTRRRPPRSGFSLVVWSALVPPIPLLIASLLLEGPQRDLAALSQLCLRSFLALCFIVYGASMLGYGIWNMLLSRHPAASVAPWSMLVPVVGAAAAFFYNGETPTVPGLIGAGITIAGVLLALGVVEAWLARRRRAGEDPVPIEPPGL